MSAPPLKPPGVHLVRFRAEGVHLVRFQASDAGSQGEGNWACVRPNPSSLEHRASTTNTQRPTPNPPLTLARMLNDAFGSQWKNNTRVATLTVPEFRHPHAGARDCTQKAFIYAKKYIPPDTECFLNYHAAYHRLYLGRGGDKILEEPKVAGKNKIQKKALKKKKKKKPKKARTKQQKKK